MKKLKKGQKKPRGNSFRLTCSVWGVLWLSENRLNGKSQHIMYGDDYLPALFRTRKEAREWIGARYGYIRTSPDLRAEPHGWKLPQAVRIILMPRLTWPERLNQKETIPPARR